MAANGRYTGCDLTNLTPLCIPWREENGLLCPVFTPDAALLSFELAASAYDLELECWREAGWRDFSYQIDNALYTGPSVNKTQSGGIGGAISEYIQHLAQARLKRSNPISQLRGVLRQREGSDTCKAIVMLHPLPGGQYLVAVGFMGTGKRIYDWFSNFRLAREEGVHSGFLQLTKGFESNFSSIVFPETARELGLSRLTLQDILDECRSPSSRFRLWMAGHSQGGSVMQLIAIREIGKGFLRQNMFGCGFASPSVVYEGQGQDLASYPLFHIINADDAFPRMGAHLHAGRCLILLPDDDMRAVCCGDSWSNPAFRPVLALMRQVTDSAMAFLIVLAMLKALNDVSREDAMTVLNGLVGSLIPEMLLGPLGTRREDILDLLSRRTLQGYALASGDQPVPESALQAFRLRIALLIRTYGPKAFSKAVLSSLSLPHKLRGADPDTGWIASYQYIVTERLDELRQKIWCAPLSGMAGRLARGERRRPVSRFASYSSQRALRQKRGT